MRGVHNNRGFAGIGFDSEKVDKHLKGVNRQVGKIKSMGSNADNVVWGQYGKSRFDKNMQKYDAKRGKRNKAIVKGLKTVGKAAKMGLKAAGPIGVLMSLFDAKPAGLGSELPRRRPKKKK